ncbi:hypothetical protein [Streptomyces cinereoruber]|uniref:hypothetical protein n=1 Tax=Streptomyces cinereoruber TaxID=67260 RepID=UPI00362E8F8F
MADRIPITDEQRAHARNQISSILNANGHWVETETADLLVDAVMTAANTPALGSRLTTWATAEDMQAAADQLRAIAPQLTGPLAPLADPVADWLDETANALAWLAPFREHEPGHRIWQTATNVARAINGNSNGSQL